MSQLQSYYETLHSLLSQLHPHLTIHGDSISKFHQLSSPDEIVQLSSSAVAAHLEVQTILDEYEEAMALIEEKINEIEDAEDKAEEQRIFARTTEGTDGATQLPVSLTTLVNFITKQEMKYDRAFKAATDRIAVLSRLPIHQSSTQSFHHSVPNLTISGHPTVITGYNQPSIPLPLMSIEPFDGSNITLWSSFYSQFQSIIGSKPELSHLMKLNYLRSLLKGEALKLIQSIPIREDLYTQTLDRLKVAYDRSNHSTALLYQNLMGLKPKSSRIEDQLICVRDMINLVYHLNDPKNLNSLPLIEQLASRVNPSFVRKIWELNPGSMMDALIFIDKDLRKELECRAVESAFYHHNQSTPIHSTDSNRDHPSVRDQNTHHSGEKSKDSPKCFYCGSNHLSINCTKYKTYEERSSRISQIRVCRRCLQSNHTYNECPVKCGKCNGTHHESICKSTSSSTHSNPITPMIQSAAVTSHTWAQTRMYTANGVIGNPNHDTTTEATVFLDTGSQVSIISRSLANKLNLEPIDEALVSIIGVTGTSEPEWEDVVLSNLVTNSNVYPVTAIVKETLSVPSMNVEALSASDIKFIEDKSISVPSSITTNHTVSPEILLDIDITHSLIKNTESTKLPSGLELIESELGPIIIGSKLSYPIESAEKNDNIIPLYCGGVSSTPVTPATMIHETTRNSIDSPDWCSVPIPIANTKIPMRSMNTMVITTRTTTTTSGQSTMTSKPTGLLFAIPTGRIMLCMS